MSPTTATYLSHSVANTAQFQLVAEHGSARADGFIGCHCTAGHDGMAPHSCLLPAYINPAQVFWPHICWQLTTRLGSSYAGVVPLHRDSSLRGRVLRLR